MSIKQIITALLVSICCASTEKSKWLTFEMNENELSRSESYNFDSNETNNLFEINLSSSKIIDKQKMFLILESDNSDFVITLIDDSKGANKAAEVMELNTLTGNIMFVMSQRFYGKKLAFFRKSGSLKFAVSCKSNEGSKDYKIRVEIAYGVSVDLGKSYTAHVDKNLSKFNVGMKYNGLSNPELQKLRFQISSVVQKKSYQLSANLGHKGQEFILNPIFQKTVGGILSLPLLPVCKEEYCNYDLKIYTQKVRVMNIESFLIPKIETISIKHYEEYYDRVYSPDSLVFYQLPFDSSMEGLDVSISLIPVIGQTALFVNAQTLPLNVENYAWKEKGHLAKKITIKWEELVQMRAERSTLYIAVSVAKPSEFLLKIDAHDQGYKGRLTSGITEAGYVAQNSFNNYLYFFDVRKTQEISFELKLSVAFGDADLYLKQCADESNCKIDEAEISSPKVLKVENNQISKLITHKFTCENPTEESLAACQFVIGVKGKESKGTHYEIYLQESNFHRLMIPGHSVHLNLNTEEVAYLKFSNPSKASKSQLFFSVEALYGSFEVFLSKSVQYPLEASHETIRESFVSTKLGLLDSLRTIRIDPANLNDSSLLGTYYVAVKANTTCSLNIKFFEKIDTEITIHTLLAGNQVRGEINHKNEIVYYSIKAQSTSESSSMVNFVLTPLKGQYTIFANSNGKMPTKSSHEFISMNSHLEIQPGTSKSEEKEYIIGIQLSSEEDIIDDSYQYLVNFVYASKPLKLNPGILSTQIVRESNKFLIEIGADMKNILIVKTVVDGYNLDMCANFISEVSQETLESCDHRALGKEVSIYFDEKTLEDKCNDPATGKRKLKCLVEVDVKGNDNQKFTIGFTHDDHPFHLVHQQMITGPIPVHSDAKLNFIYHPEPSKPIGLYFNSKGRDVQIFTKLVRNDHFDDKEALTFPTNDNFDSEKQFKNGYITTVMYDEKYLQEFGGQSELLITIRGGSSNEKEFFDGLYHFILQSSIETHEILRTQTLDIDIEADVWTYFTFYNNGNSKSLKVYVSTTSVTQLEVHMCKGLQTKPPLTNKAPISKSGISSVELDVTEEDLKMDASAGSSGLRGHYTLAVKAANNSHLNVFWNNKDDLTYVELTPNQPTTLQLDPDRKLYFTFYAEDANDKISGENGDISIYIKSVSPLNAYIIHTDGTLNAPTSYNFEWKSSLGQKGGISYIRIQPNDVNYCAKCLYVGCIESSSKGQITLLANIKHDRIPITLVSGMTIPDAVQSDEKVMYRIKKIDENPVNLSISMLNGFIKVYIGNYDDLSIDKSESSYSLASSYDTHKFITIKPSDFVGGDSRNYFILIHNEKAEMATFTMSVSQSGMRSPIEPGLTKFMELAPGEFSDLIYSPSVDEKIFEVKLELRQVFKPEIASHAMQILSKFISVNYVNEFGTTYKLEKKSLSLSNNKLFASYEVAESGKGTYAVHLQNPTGSKVALTVDLMNGGYKLLNLNEFNVDIVREKYVKLYEAYGQQSQYLYVDLKVCYGDVELQFYQSDYQNVAQNNSTEFKKIDYKHSLSHFIKLDHQKAFLKVANKVSGPSIYEISVYGEKDTTTNPFTEVSEGNGGRVDFETDSNLIHFQPIKISTTYSQDFFHGVNYTVFITDDPHKLRYIKNCGSFMIDQVFDNPHVHTFSKVSIYENSVDYTKKRNPVKIQLSGLTPNTKYYGIVVAKINILPAEKGYLTPIRTGKAYYDQFVFVTAKIDLPFGLIVVTLILIGVCVGLALIIQVLVFGKVGSLNMLDKFKDLANFELETNGSKILSILENNYCGDLEPYSGSQSSNPDSHHADIEFGQGAGIELTSYSLENKA